MSSDPQAAFLEAYEQYADAIFRHCFFRLSDRERALELTQETFTRAWDYLRAGKEIEKFRPFLYRVAGNLVIEEYRKKKTVSLDAFLDDEFHDESMLPALHDDDALERLADAFEGEQARAALDKLSPPYREVVVLRFIDGLSPKEIAAHLEERENTVSVRLHRALAELRKHVQPS
jgi:RNA polymerase sigma-70 factor (ECF subfamily)